MPMVVPISTREPKQTVNQSATTPLKRIVAAESTNQKAISIIRKQYERISKTCRWWYCKITPPGYKWKPKSRTLNVELNVSMHLGTKSRTTNISEPTTLSKSTVSNTPSSSNSFATRRDNFIHRRLWVLRAHDGKSQASKSGSKECSRGTDLYSISPQDTSTPNPIFLMAKATSSQAWLWHRHLSHLNIDTINLLSKYDIVTGLPKLKFIKDHLCSSYELGKAKHKSFKTKTTPSLKRRLQILHMDLCGPMRVESFNDQVSSDPVLQCPTTALEHASLSPGPQSQENVPHSAETVTTSNELDLLFSLMFDELLNGTTQVVSKSSTVTTADAPNQRQKQHTTPSTSTTVVADTPPLNIQTTPKTTSQAPTQAPTVTANENII
ncbi:retrovirus-related pol polyprotein from transposon TNT 1-94 [Tanacetum coccineum]